MEAHLIPPQIIVAAVMFLCGPAFALMYKEFKPIDTKNVSFQTMPPSMRAEVIKYLDGKCVVLADGSLLQWQIPAFGDYIPDDKLDRFYEKPKPLPASSLRRIGANDPPPRYLTNGWHYVINNADVKAAGLSFLRSHVFQSTPSNTYLIGDGDSALEREDGSKKLLDNEYFSVLAIEDGFYEYTTLIGSFRRVLKYKEQRLPAPKADDLIRHLNGGGEIFLPGGYSVKRCPECQANVLSSKTCGTCNQKGWLQNPQRIRLVR